MCVYIYEGKCRLYTFTGKEIHLLSYLYRRKNYASKNKNKYKVNKTQINQDLNELINTNFPSLF